MAFRRCSAVVPHAHSTASVGGNSAAEKQPSHQSMSSNSLPPARVLQFAVATVDSKDSMSLRHEHERERERERERAVG